MAVQHLLHVKVKAMTKNELRQEHLNIRKQMTQDEVQDKSSLLVKRLIAQKWFVEAELIFCYKAFNNEVTLTELMGLDKTIALPQVVDATTMVFRSVNDTTQFVKSSYGVLEPVDGPVVEVTEQSVILMPGACFDLKGNRIGYGGGYYDRYLHSQTYQGKRVGVCYNHQISKTLLPSESYDVPVDAIITESRYVEFNDIQC